MHSEQRAWLVDALEKTPPPDPYWYDSPARTLIEGMDDWPLTNLVPLYLDLDDLLARTPHIEPDQPGLSERFVWLVPVVNHLLLKLITTRYARLLDPAILERINRMRLAEHLTFNREDPSPQNLRLAILAWPAMNHALFWADAAIAKAEKQLASDVLTESRWVGQYNCLWTYSGDCADLFLEDLTARSDTNDRTLALDVLCALPHAPNSPAETSERVDAAVEHDPILKQKLVEIRQSNESKRQVFQRKKAEHKREQQVRHDEDELDKQRFIEKLQTMLPSIQQSETPGIPSPPQRALVKQLRLKGADHGDLSVLDTEFGPDIALAFSQGAKRFWRTYTPPLRSDHPASSPNDWAVELGLIGLALETCDPDTWASGLSSELASQASRYALLQHNGFPDWLQALHRAHPGQVLETLNREIGFELDQGVEHELLSGTLSTVFQSGQWTWQDLAPHLMERLSNTTWDTVTLQSLLVILIRVDLTFPGVAKNAARRAGRTKDPVKSSLWYAAWILTNPDRALVSFKRKLDQSLLPEAATDLAVRTVTRLFSSWDRFGGWYREGLLNASQLQTLAQLAFRHIRPEEDIKRPSHKPFTPKLRDDAERARDTIVQQIVQIGNRDAYNALITLSQELPHPQLRLWMVQHANDVATAAADLSAINARDIQELWCRYEIPPQNQRELSELVIDRLSDLKADLEHGDTSPAEDWLALGETKLRRNIADWLITHSVDRYTVDQENELADARRPDIRVGCNAIRPVPIELKIADKWSGAEHVKAIRNQLVDGYLRDRHSGYGIFLILYNGEKQSWLLPGGRKADGLEALVSGLQDHWHQISGRYPGVEDVRVVSIDLTVRNRSASKLA